MSLVGKELISSHHTRNPRTAYIFASVIHSKILCILHFILLEGSLNYHSHTELEAFNICPSCKRSEDGDESEWAGCDFCPQ